MTHESLPLPQGKISVHRIHIAYLDSKSPEKRRLYHHPAQIRKMDRAVQHKLEHIRTNLC